MQTSEKLDLALLNNFFEQEGSVAFVYLFGSYASGKTGPMSDVDLAVYLDIDNKILRFKKRCNLIGKLLHILKKDLDLVVLNDVQNNFLLHDIFKQGKLIYKKNEDLYFNFRTKKLHNVLDFITRYNYVKQRKNLTNA